MAVLRGTCVEKAGVNISEVFGDNYPALEDKLKGLPFYATGLSSISHMQNPYAPIGHMNIRMITVGDEFWFGGGADLTPMHEFAEDTELFHQRLELACEEFQKGSYKKFKKACDEYFYIKHRNSVRGVGGVFFDHLKGDFEQLFSFIKSIAFAYIEVYPQIIKKRSALNFSELEKEQQLYWRGRYAEFNLVYDRGTRFGLLTGGNPEAIFVSLPPTVKW